MKKKSFIYYLFDRTGLMKKHKSNQQHLPLNVVASFDNGGLFKAIVERLAYKKSGRTYKKIGLPKGFRSMDTSTIETYVSGKSVLTGESRAATIQFESCFLFTCARSSDSVYTMAWSNSLS